MRQKKQLWNILVPVLVLAALAAAFCMGGPAVPRGSETDSASPALSGQAAPVSGPEADNSASPEADFPQADAPEPADGLDAASGLPEPASTPEPGDTGGTAGESGPETGSEPHQAAPGPEGNPSSVEPQDAAAGDGSYSCTISISCASILDNLELCDPDKVELVPEDGWILEPVTVPFDEGESVFDVLQRVCRQEKIHMEYEDTPLYSSAYIEGIHNLYEFDAGELSGWMYTVNGWFPNYGCSRCLLQDGDVVCWVYTCDLGSDVGGGYSTGNQQGESSPEGAAYPRF